MAYKTELLRRLKALKEINERTRAEIQREESAQSLLSQRFNDDPEVQALHKECTAVQAQAGRLREAKEVLEKNSGAGSCGLKLYTDVDGRQCYSFKPASYALVHNAQLHAVRSMSAFRLLIAQDHAPEKPIDPIKYRLALCEKSESLTLSPIHEEGYPAWMVLKGTLVLAAVVKEEVFAAFVAGQLCTLKGYFFEHFSEHAFDSSNLQHLSTALDQYEVVASCFFDIAWEGCFREVADMFKASRASEVLWVPSAYICYVVHELFRIYCFITSRKFDRTEAEAKEGFPERLLVVSDVVGLFKVIFRRLPLYLTETKVAHWQRSFQQGSSAASIFEKQRATEIKKRSGDRKTKHESKPTSASKSKISPSSKRRRAVGVEADPRSEGDEVSSGDDADLSDTSSEVHTTPAHKGFCAYWLLEYFKIGGKKCPNATCPFIHALPSAKFIPRLCKNLERMTIPLLEEDWDKLLVALGAKPRKG